MAFVTESWGDRELARVIRSKQDIFGPPLEELFSHIFKIEKEHKMAHILYDLVDVQGSETRGSYTACRVCGAVVTVADHEKHDEWHAKIDASTGYQPPPKSEPVPETDWHPFQEGTGFTVMCPHCNGGSCRLRDEYIRVGLRHVAVPLICVRCENRFTVTFRGNLTWTGMVTESKS